MSRSKVVSYSVPRTAAWELSQFVPQLAHSAFAWRAVMREVDLNRDNTRRASIDTNTVEAYRRGWVNGICEGASQDPGKEYEPEEIETFFLREPDSPRIGSPKSFRE